MSLAVQSAIDILRPALSAVDWVAECGDSATVDATPERAFTQKEYQNSCVIHLSGGGTSRSFVIRGVMPLINEPQVVLSVIRYLIPDSNGRVDSAALAKAESVVDKAVATVVAAIKSSGTLALMSPIEQPERYQQELLRQGTFLTAVIFNLKGG